MNTWRFSSPEAEQRYDQRMADAYYWETKAAEVRAAEKQKRDASVRARQEIVQHLLEPGRLNDLVIARATMNVPVSAGDRRAPAKFVWMPAGRHDISASTMSGSAFNGVVVCDEAAASNVIASFNELTKDGFRSYIDFAHRDSEAAAWVDGFTWVPSVGILVGVSWTPAGETAIIDRVFMSFSPTFWIDHETGRVAGLVKGHAAGGLVNAPAFGKAMPPILATHAMSGLIRETMIGNGRPASSADVVANAVEAGYPAETIRVLMETLP